MPLTSPHTHQTHRLHPELTDWLIGYHDTGGYARDLEQVGEQALACLNSIKASKRGSPPLALVLDIDETALSNAWDMIKPTTAPFDPKKWDQWIMQGRAKAIQPTLRLFNAARKKGWTVFFITGRPDAQLAVTERNLKAQGFAGWQEIITEPVAANRSGTLVFPEAATFKTAARWSITERGYHIALNVGDQMSDLNSGYGDYTFKLPNPFYTII